METGKLHTELSTSCVCEVVYESENDFVPVSDCFGCFDESRDYLLNDFLPLWESRNAATDTVRIDGSAMGWTRASGWLVTDASNLLDALALDRADYSLAFTLDGSELSVTRYSHDEPTGAHFAVTFVPDEVDLFV